MLETDSILLRIPAKDWGINPASALNTGEGAVSDIVPGATSTPYDLTIGDSVAGFVNTALDQDWYRVQLVAGQTYTFTLTATSGGLDCWAEIHDAGGALLAQDDDGGPGTDSVLQFLCTQTGTYYVSAQAYHDASQSSSGGYLLQSSVGATPPDILQSIDWGTVVSTPSNITVYFATAGQSFGGYTSQGWNAYQQQQVMLALQQWANVANLTFSITTNSATATFKLVTANLSGGTLGQMSPPGESGAGIAVFGTNNSSWTTVAGGTLEPGGNGFVTLIHEFGHGLGLAHPHDNGGTSSVMQRVTAAFDSYGLFDLDQGIFTTMSYNRAWETGPNGIIASNSFNQATPMALDIALIQQKYGANMSYHTGDDTYQLPTSNTVTTFYSAIWDAGGSDTIAYGGSAHANIDLNAATIDYTASGGGNVSWVDGVYGGFTIARNVVIENASGGSAGDVLIGNGADNHLYGNGGNDTLYGNDGNDLLDAGSGVDTLYGGAGDDAFIFGPDFTAADHVDGGAGSNDQIGIQGDYSGANALTLGASTITGVEVIVVMPGFNYEITTVDANVAAGATLYISASTLGASNHLTFNGSTETDGNVFTFGSFGADSVTGGAGADGFYFGPGRFDASDVVNGGPGTNDQFGLDGNYTLTLGGNITNVEVLVLIQKQSQPPNTFNITTADAFVASGATMTVYGVQVVTPIFFNGAGESNGKFTIFGGSGADTLIGGAGADWFYGGAGADVMTGNGGADTFFYDALSQSSSTGFDTLQGFSFAVDFLDLPGVHDTYGYVTTGALSSGSFDANLASALAGMAAGQAIFFDPNAGTFAGQHFLVVDGNGVAGYQAGQDWVFKFDVAAPVNPPPDFIV